MTTLRASDVPVGNHTVMAAGEAVRAVALQHLPDAWHVLPDGRATHSVLATAVMQAMTRHGQEDRGGPA